MNVGTMTIKSRRSVRKFKPSTIPPYVIQDVLDCGRLAPTAGNVQPWLFGAITDREILGTIADLTDHGKFIAEATVCIAVFGKVGETYYLEDCSAATENMIIAFQNHGIGSCWVAGDKKPYAEQVREILNVPRGVHARLVDPGRRPRRSREPPEETARRVFLPEPIRGDGSLGHRGPPGDDDERWVSSAGPTPTNKYIFS